MTTTKEFAPVKVGSIFQCSWGYDQTNVDFYEVLEISKSGKTVKVRQIRSHSDDNRYQPSVRVVPHRVPLNNEVLTKRLRPPMGSWGASFRIASYADAYQWDGSPVRETGIGWGH